MNAGSERMVVPILAIHVNRYRAESAGRNIDMTQTQLENYFITPDDARGGSSARRMSFLEAINRMVF